MWIRDKFEDARDGLVAFATTPVPDDGTLVYRIIGWWLRIVCWMLVIAAAVVIVGAIAAMIMLPVATNSLDAVMIGIVMGALASLALMALGIGLGLTWLLSATYGGWVERRSGALWGVRALALAILSVGLASVALEFSPLALYVAAVAIAATGALVLLWTVLPSARRQFRVTSETVF